MQRKRAGRDQLRRPGIRRSGAERRTAARAGALPGRVDRRHRRSDHAAAARTDQGPRLSGAPAVRRRGAGAVHERGRARRAASTSCIWNSAATGALANTGINIKAHGYTEANPATGQLTAKFLENPQAPFSELKIDLNGGPRAPLDNPPACGPAVTTADLTPWSAPGETPEGLLGARHARRDAVVVLRGGKAARVRPGLSRGSRRGR